MITRICKLCPKEFKITSSRQIYCTDCKAIAEKLYNEQYMKIYNKKYRQEHKEELKERGKIYYQSHKKEIKPKNCPICKKEFIQNHNKSNGQKYCAVCSEITQKEQKKKDDKKYYKIHKEECVKRTEQWIAENRERYLEMGRKYYQLHKIEDSIRCKEYSRTHREQLKKYHKEWKKKHPMALFVDSLRHRIKEAIKHNYKSAHTLELLGCSIEQLKQHLETHFQAGMTWKNYGKWHVDHIKPCARFDLSKSEEQKICFNYKNLQPLWAIDNLKKGCKFEEKEN